jgi:hypothetical protein
MKITIIISFQKLSDEELLLYGRKIVKDMTGNTNFAEPKPALTEVTTSLNAFGTSLENHRPGDEPTTSLKNECRADVEEKLKLLGLYVQINCKNNMTIALSSGFKVKRAGQTIGEFPPPTDITITNAETSGILNIEVKLPKGTKGAKVFVYEHTEAPVTDKSVWKTELGNRKIALRDLVPGTQQAIRVAIKGAAENLNFSKIMYHYVA